jgi:hypothetical protein
VEERQCWGAREGCAERFSSPRSLPPPRRPALYMVDGPLAGRTYEGPDYDLGVD